MQYTQLKNSLFKGKKLALIAAVTMVLLLATGFIWAYKKVNIAVDGSLLTVQTLHGQPVDVLAQAGVNLGPQDEYRLSTSKLTNGATITVYRAVPITITYQGQTTTIQTGSPTVGELAVSLGLTDENIRFTPGRDESIQAGLHIQAVVLSEQVIEREEPEAFQVLRQPDDTLEKGTEQVIQQGEDGSKLVTVKLQFADGVQTSEEILAVQVTQPSTPKIIRTGARDLIETSRGTQRFRRVEVMEATAYLPTDGGGHGITATGIRARHGVVAVDPSVIPLGSRVYIPGYGLALAADTGGAIVGNRIDLCMESSSDAWGFGRRMVKVYVLAE